MWAFGTSVHGLGLKEEYLWSLTPCEYHYLRRQWQAQRDHSLWQTATIQATLYNAHFRGQFDAEYLPGDFMGKGDRAARQAAAKRQHMQDQVDLMRARAKLAAMKPNEEPDDLPVWARG